MVLNEKILVYIEIVCSKYLYRKKKVAASMMYVVKCIAEIVYMGGSIINAYGRNLSGAAARTGNFRKNGN